MYLYYHDARIKVWFFGVTRVVFLIKKVKLEKFYNAVNKNYQTKKNAVISKRNKIFISNIFHKDRNNERGNKKRSQKTGQQY